MQGHILLTPLKWFQEISHYPAINVEGRNLKVSCTAAAPDVLLSNNAKWTDLPVELGILIGEQPLDGDGNPLKQGVGCFYFSDAQQAAENITQVTSYPGLALSTSLECAAIACLGSLLSFRRLLRSTWAT